MRTQLYCIEYIVLKLITCCTSRVWISSDDVVAVAKKGYRFIHAASDYFYLVRFCLLLSFCTHKSNIVVSAGLWCWWLGWCESHWVSSETENCSEIVFLILAYSVYRNSWCDPFKTWQFSYSFDPTGNLTAEESKLVMGGNRYLSVLKIFVSNVVAL